MMRNVHGLKIWTSLPTQLGYLNHGTTHLKDILRPTEGSEDNENVLKTMGSINYEDCSINQIMDV